MEPVLIILVPGLLGGIVVALLIAGNRTGPPSTFVSRRLAAPSPTLINMAHIRVEGVGGLGMVAAVVLVALVDPRIRAAIAIAAVLGAALGVFLIARARRTGPLASGGDPGAHSMLGIDADQRRSHRAAVSVEESPCRPSAGTRSEALMSPPPLRSVGRSNTTAFKGTVPDCLRALLNRAAVLDKS